MIAECQRFDCKLEDAKLKDAEMFHHPARSSVVPEWTLVRSRRNGRRAIMNFDLLRAFMGLSTTKSL